MELRKMDCIDLGPVVIYPDETASFKEKIRRDKRIAKIITPDGVAVTIYGHSPLFCKLGKRYKIYAMNGSDAYYSLWNYNLSDLKIEF